MKILVVDDSRAMRKIIRNALEDMGYSASSVIEASDGEEAMAKLQECRFKIDIILADWNMPNMDGMTLLNQVQDSEQLRRIPFVMIVGEAQRDRVTEAVLAGARNYLVKPFTLEALRRKVLAIEKELLARRNPSDTAVVRFEAVNVPERPDAELSFLAQLPEELVAGICASASRLEHEEGEVLIRPGDVVRSLNIVDTGEIEIDSPPVRAPTSFNDGRLSEVYRHGECFGELSFLTGDPAGLSARARTDVVVASVGRSDFEDLLAEYPNLSVYLARLLARRARKTDAKLTSELEQGLSGRLSTIALPELVQTLHNSQKTGLLRVENSGEEGEVYFVDGNVRQAQIGSQKGEEAFYQLVAWAEGGFTFEAGSHRIEPGIFQPTTGLLMEGMRRQDELRLGAAGPCDSRPADWGRPAVS